MARSWTWLAGLGLASSCAVAAGCAEDTISFGSGQSGGSTTTTHSNGGSGATAQGGGGAGAGPQGGTGGVGGAGNAGGGGAGQCAQPSDCDDGNACTQNLCVNEHCANPAINIDDLNPCTIDLCDAHTGPSHVPVDVDDHNVCTRDSCDPETGISHTLSIVLFEEHFADNAQGWQLGPEWQIGPAAASTGGQYGADPATDHTPTSDNGLAGVVIGGNESIAQTHAYAYLTSPPFDTSGATRHVVLSFWRWLVSDWAPYMHNTVEVWDGTAWVPLWTSDVEPAIDDTPPGGNGWTLISYDLTSYANPSMAVRFGFDIAQLPAYAVGSWSIDDVEVVDQAAAADNNLCTLDSCDPVLGAQYTPTAADDNNVCTTDSCDPSRGITHTLVTTSDNNVCTTDSCDPVLGVQHTPVNCTDNDPCTVDSCDPLLGCQYTPTPTVEPHDRCTTGAPLVSNACADPCIVSICASSPSCCSTSWTAACTQAVRTGCKSLVCAESAGTCPHTLCSLGGPTTPFTSGCDSAQANCVASICAFDAYCCTTDWDDQCVGEVQSVCGDNCNGA